MLVKNAFNIKFCLNIDIDEFVKFVNISRAICCPPPVPVETNKIVSDFEHLDGGV